MQHVTPTLDDIHTTLFQRSIEALQAGLTLSDGTGKFVMF